MGLDLTRMAAAGLATALALGLLGGCRGRFPRESEDTRVAEDTFDEHGWQGRIAVTLDGGRIRSVVFDEFDRSGRAKSGDAAYAKQMEPVSRTTPAKAAVELQQRLVAAQSPDLVEAVAGATTTSARFTRLAREAIGRR